MNTEKRGLLTKCENALVEYLSEDISIKNLSIKHGVMASFLSGYFLGKEVDVYERKSNVNNNIFDIIDTEEKAYWLGFMYADGCVSYDESKNRCRIEISLKQDDWEHLNKFRTFLEYGVELKYRPKQRAYRVSFSSKKMCQDLIKNGCVPAKSLILEFPSCDIVSKELIKHFVRGYFDGDGSIPKASIMSPMLLGTKDFLLGILENIQISDYPELKHDPRHSDKVFFIRFRTKSGYEFLKWMYEDSTIFLDRKKQLFELGLTQNFKIFSKK